MLRRAHLATLTALVVALAIATPAAQAAKKIKVTTTTVTKTPKVQSTVHFNGYATYVFRPAKGRRIVGAAARIVGGTKNAVGIRSRRLSTTGLTYTVKLVFPGEQGTPGRLVVTLRTVAAPT